MNFTEFRSKWDQFKIGKYKNATIKSEFLKVFNDFYSEHFETIPEILPIEKTLLEILPAVRMILTPENKQISLSSGNSSVLSSFCNNRQAVDFIKTPLTPNQLYCSSKQLCIVEHQLEPLKLIEEIQASVNNYNQVHGFLPDLLWICNLGLIACSEKHRNSIEIINEFLKLLTIYNSIDDIEYWEMLDEIEQIRLEETKYKSENFKVKNLINQKIVIITGGAQGFGGGLAEKMYLDGANVIISDINEKAGNEFIKKIQREEFDNNLFFVKTDVSDPNSVQILINETLRHFGGLDVLISNAGILRAGGLDEMQPETFEMVTKVNYNGYFNCVKFASKVLKLQTKFSKNPYFTDIIQINSKSGLRGSNKNFAYAGGKFGGIGLTQSFALELMPFQIKVNSICPGNFFDGPLWSDPVNGLFVQYLNAGKVPGAKTIEDVKKYYEDQVPAKRGCKVEDVLKAIYYAIEQEYETGQAIPVSGGQVMLN